MLLLILINLNIQHSYAETIFKIITLQHRFADDILPTISPMVGVDGTATGVRNQLILRASPERMREIEATIQVLDTARENRKITVNRDSNQSTQNSRIDANGKIKVGNVSIGNNRNANSNSGNINIENTTRTTKQTSSQFLNVLDGERAFIRVGQYVPFTQEWVNISSRYVQIEQITDWQEVSTGFAVRPRTIGNQVELEITPRITKRNGSGNIDFQTLSTTIRVKLGEWVNIGNTMENHDEISRKILGYSQGASDNHSNLKIKVD